MKLRKGPMDRLVLLLLGVVCCAVATVSADVMLIVGNNTMTFDDIEANFAPSIVGPHVSGILYIAEPLDACEKLNNTAPKSPTSPFALVIRGGCQFDVKVRNVQDAGFQAAIIYDNEYDSALVSMAGSSDGIYIYAVFVLRVAGEVLKQYAGRADVKVWIVPTYYDSAWSILAISFISLLAMSGVLATCFFLRRRHFRNDGTRFREFHGLSRQLVNAMPTITFSKVQNGNSTSSTCVICQCDYIAGDRLRMLPCYHKYHADCVDKWLIDYGIFCPVCKHDPRDPVITPPASETTPILQTPSPASLATVASVESISRNGSLHPSPQINPGVESSSIVTRRAPVAKSMVISASKSSLDLRNISNRSHTWHPVSPYILGSPYIHEEGSPYILHPANGSPTFLVISPDHESFPRRFSGSSAHITVSATSQSARYSSGRHNLEFEPTLPTISSPAFGDSLALSSAPSLPGV